MDIRFMSIVAFMCRMTVVRVSRKVATRPELSVRMSGSQSLLKLLPITERVGVSASKFWGHEYGLCCARMPT
eukprot:2320451-Pleurochrysis_carterae.AAC.1